MKSISSYKELFDDIEPEYQSNRISIAERKNLKTLLALYTPSPWEYILSVCFMLIILLYLISGNEIDDITYFILIIALPFFLWLLFVTRSITTVVDYGEDESLYVKKHGLFGSELNSSLEIISVLNVKNVVMKRHISRYRDRFEVLLDYDHSRRIPLTGKSLTFEECQIFAEAINKFLKIKDNVIAVD